MGGSRSVTETTGCLRCDAPVPTGVGDGLTLTFNQETGAVKVCDECKSVVKDRDLIKNP